MSVDEARRLALHEAAAHNHWNAEAALTLMELLPPSGWGDVVRRSDLDGLEQRMDLRFQLVDQRFAALQDHLDARIERALNRSLRWMVGMMVAMTGVFGAITRLG